ncbi:MAG TPA: cytochrome c oxidase subunit II [Acidimicrobiales bacterium]|nr:cytochrome c oxidase subunit II [Acidimicrobiales bacterium]
MLFLGLVAGSGLLLPACGSDRFGAPDPVTEQGERILGLWRGSVLAAAAVGLLVWGLIAWSVLRYRRRGDEVPGQTAHNVPMEVLYTAVPVMIVAVLFGFTVVTQRDVNALSPDPDLVVEATGFQWQWQFRYPDDGVVVTGTPGEPATMVLPVGSTVRLRLVSPDVVHSFWVPRFLAKRDLIPGVRNEIEVDVKEEGTWVGRCAEFCGLDHYRMNFSVQAVPEAEFRRWVAANQAPASNDPVTRP